MTQMVIEMQMGFRRSVHGDDQKVKVAVQCLLLCLGSSSFSRARLAMSATIFLRISGILAPVRRLRHTPAWFRDTLEHAPSILLARSGYAS